MTLDKYSLPIPAVPAGKIGKEAVNPFTTKDINGTERTLNDRGRSQLTANDWFASKYDGMTPEEIAFWQAVRSSLTLLTNQAGKLGKAAVLWDDLANLNLVKEATDGNGSPVFTASSPEEIEEILDLDPPPTPTGLSLVTSINAITLTWGGYSLVESNMAYVSVYRNTVDDIDTATAIGTSSGYGYIDKTVQDANTYYYWVRGNSTSGVQGLYNSTAGTSAYLEATPTSMINELAKQVTAQQAVGGAEVWKFNKDLFAIETLSGDYPFLIQTVTIGGVPTSKIAFNASTWIADANIETAKIANLDVETAKFANLAAVNAKFDNASVATAKIQDAAITTAKIGDAQVETLKIGDQQVTLTQVYEFVYVDDFSPRPAQGLGNSNNYPIIDNIAFGSDYLTGTWSDYHTGIRIPYLASDAGGKIFIQFPIISPSFSAFLWQTNQAWVIPEISVWIGGQKRFSLEPKQNSLYTLRNQTRGDMWYEYGVGYFYGGVPIFCIPATLPEFVSLGDAFDNSADPYIYIKGRSICWPGGPVYSCFNSSMPHFGAYYNTTNGSGEGGGINPETGTFFAHGYAPATYNLETWNGYRAPHYGKIPIIRVFEAKR